MRATVVGPAVLGLVLALVGCDGDAADPPPPPSAELSPTLTDTECPPQVDNVLMTGYSCQLLTVADGIQLLVTRIDPSTGPVLDDPLIMVGEEYGSTINYAGLEAMPDRIGRTAYLLNARGIDGSQPALTCPEVDEVDGQAAWLAAVQQCHDRLLDSGVDLAAYGSDAMAGDVLALVEALGVERWGMGTWGGASVVAFRVLAQDPEGLDAVFMDSPQLPGDDPRLTLADDTRRAVGDVLAACAADAACAKLPHSLADLDAAVAALDAAPLTRTVAGRTMTVDGTMLLRLVRHSLAHHGAGTAALTTEAVPAMIAASAHWTKAMDDALLSALTGSAPYCEGYLVTCTSFHRASLGVVLTELCRNHDPAAELTPGEDAIGRYATTSPYAAACGSWPVERNEAPDVDLPTSDVPALVLVGEYDPFTDPDRVRETFAGMPNAHVVEIPGFGRNPIAVPCAGDIRGAFFADLAAPLEDDCLADVPPTPAFWPHL